MVRQHVLGKRDRAIVFDGDDTLWETQTLYDSAKGQFAKLVSEAGIRADNVVEMLDKVDAEQVPEMGFSKERFPSSMARTYKELCVMQKCPVDPEVLERAHSIGNSVFSQAPQLYFDAVQGLESLRPHYLVVLATKGDEEVQAQRLEALNIRPYFDAIYILSSKTDKEYAMIVNELALPRTRMWAVGNSVRSDINPALRAGLRCVLIPRGVWEYEKDVTTEGECLVANSVIEAASMIMRQDQLGDWGQGDQI